VRTYDPPQTHLELTGHNGNFEVTGKLFLAQPLPPLAQWQFPTNTIHSPYLSITATRGISDWLKQQPWVMSLGINPLPDQAFSWVLPQMAFQAYTAMPLANAPGAMPKLHDAMAKLLQEGSPTSPYKRLHLEETNNQLALTGMPWMAPYFQPIHEASGEFLLMAGFPHNPHGRPAPPEFFSELNKPAVVYYNWENTGERLKIFPQLYQLVLVMTDHRQLDVKSAGGAWLAHLQPTLGTSVTEVTETSPTELTFTRQAPAGLTALELVAFASWLEAPNFPGCDLRMPPRKMPPHRPLAPGATPPPFTLHH
jgi:hypothetical protein